MRIDEVLACDWCLVNVSWLWYTTFITHQFLHEQSTSLSRVQVAAARLFSEVFVSATTHIVVRHMSVVLISKYNNFKSLIIDFKSVHAWNSIFGVSLSSKLNYCMTFALLGQWILWQINMLNFSKRIEKLLNIAMSNTSTKSILQTSYINTIVFLFALASGATLSSWIVSSINRKKLSLNK